MKSLLLAAALLLSAPAFAMETNALPCATKAKEVHAALKIAGKLLATPQENWRSQDIDKVYDVLNKYKGSSLAEENVAE